MAEYRASKIMHNGDEITLGEAPISDEWEKIGDLPTSSTCITFDRGRYKEFYVIYPNVTTNQNSTAVTILTDSLPSEGCASYPSTGCAYLCFSPTSIQVRVGSNNANASVWGKAKNTSGGKIGYVDVLIVGGGGCGGRQSTNYDYGYGGGGGGVVECYHYPLYGQYPISVKVGMGGGENLCSYSCGCLTSRFSTLYACGGFPTSGIGTECYHDRGTSGYPQINDAISPTISYTIQCTTCLNGCTASSIFPIGGNGAGGVSPQPVDTGFVKNKCGCCGSYSPKTFRGDGGPGYYSTISGEGHYYGGGGGSAGGGGRTTICYYDGSHRECYDNGQSEPGCGCHGGGNGGYSYSGHVGYNCDCDGRCFTRGQDGQYYGGGAGGGACSCIQYDGTNDGCCRCSRGYQGIVIIRYPTDGSYNMSNNTLGGDITTCTINGVEYRIHTFTDTREPATFYPVFK